MDVVELLPRLHLLRFPVGQACLWRDGADHADLTLIDAGPPGSGAPIAEAVTALGRDPRDVRRIVLTHFHWDHAGGAAEFAALSGAEVLAHRLDAPVVRGEVRARSRCSRTGSGRCTSRLRSSGPRVTSCGRRGSRSWPGARSWTGAAACTSSMCRGTRTAVSRSISRSTGAVHG